MQTILAARGVVRRWSGLTTIIMLAAIVVLPRLAKLLPTELAINGTRTVPNAHHMLHPNAGLDYYGFMMNGGSPPSPRGPRFGNGGANLAAGFAAAIGDRGSSDPALSWIQTGKGTGAAKVSVRSASASGATVTIEIPGVQTEAVDIRGEQYTKLTIPGAVSTGFGVGKAEVPSIPVLLARPTGSSVSLSILSIETETLHVARVFPTQPPLKAGEQAGPLVVDNSFYASDVEHPSSRLSSPSLATWRDLDVVNVHVYPVAVRPAQHEIIVTSRITFRADFSGGRYPTKVASWMQPMYQRLIRNFDNLRFAATSIEPPGTKCLILCYYMYADNSELLHLRDTLNLLGDSTEIVVVGGSSGVPAQAVAIKDTILGQYVHQDSVLRWVFLVGECSEIPPRANYHKHEFGQGETSIVPYSDYWYSDLDERALLQPGLGYEDSCDNYPEVGIARLSPDLQGAQGANQDLTNQVMKIKDYMLGRLDTTGGWLNKVTLVAHKDHADLIRGVDTMPLRFYQFLRDTIMGSQSGINNSNIDLAVGNGTGVLIYLGNGHPDCWLGWNCDVADPNWTTSDVHDLHNTHTPVVFNIACKCCSLSVPTCLSEQWMRDSGCGAVASFGHTGEVWCWPDFVQCSLAVRAIGDSWDGVHHGDTVYRAPILDLGGIKMLMDADIATKWAWENDSLLAPYLVNIYTSMWLGSPSMQIWSGGNPQPAVVTYPSWIPTGDARAFTVTVEMGSDKVEGAQVCVSSDDFYVVGTTDASGMVTFSLDAESEGVIHVAASKGHCVGQPHTPMLPYFGTSYAGGNGPQMTYPDWGRKLARDPNTGYLHVVYTGNDTVFYTQSTDDGATWPTLEPIGEGTSPAMVLNIVVGDPPQNIPWVVYLTPDGSIERAIRVSEGTWDKAVVFPGRVDTIAGAPSLAACPFVGPPGPEAYVVYPVSFGDTLLNNLVYFNTFSMYGASQAETVDIAGTLDCYGASVVAIPGSGVNVSWIKDQSVFYSQRQYGIWSPPFQISSPSPSWPITEPASNPSMEAYGDSVFCVWSGPNDDSVYPHDIWRRAHWLSWAAQYWPIAATNQSQSSGVESDFPVMTTSFATVWHEEAPPGNFDIWGRFLGDLGPRPFFQTPSPSYYPHVDGYWVPNQWTFRCNTVWTEHSTSESPLCTLAFGACDWNPWLGKGLGPGPREGYEPASYYAAEIGKPKQSPYCLSRGGFAQFESLSVDTSATGLAYQLPYLDPRRAYKLRAVLYHEGEGMWRADLRCDSGPWEHVKVDPRVPDTVWAQVPKRCYKDDARIVIELTRATGDYVSLAGLKLFQIEEETRGDGGVQSWGTGMKFVTRLRGCTPNPFAKGTSVNYELAQYGPVELTVHDVSGRLVRKLESGPRQRGFHAARWDGSDGRNHALPAGVYFVRYSAGGNVSTGRLTLVR